MPTIYYAHPVTHYGASIEEMDVETLESMGFTVVNPNSEFHDANYKKRGMGYFLEMVGRCDWIAVMPFSDGALGAGVSQELEHAKDCDKPSILFKPVNKILTIEETQNRIAGFVK